MSGKGRLGAKDSRPRFVAVNSRKEPTTMARILRHFQGRKFTTIDIAEELGISREHASVSLRRLVTFGWVDGELIESDPQMDFFEEVRTARGCGKIMEYEVVDASAIDDIEGTFLDEATRAYLDTLRPLVGVV